MIRGLDRYDGAVLSKPRASGDDPAPAPARLRTSE